MASEITICSNALLELGDSPIASFAVSEGKRATTCANLWPQVRDMLLRRHPWPCARKRVILAPEADGAYPDLFDWGYSFLLPGDWLRSLQYGARGERLAFEVEGRRILADTNTLKLVYVWRNTDPALWDDMLVDLACKEMVALLAYPITKSASLAEMKRKEADQFLREAKSIAGQDNEPEDWGDSPFTDVRGG